MPGVKTTAGTSLSTSAAAPATFNAAGYAALTWTVVGEVVDLGDFGRVFALVTHQPLATRSTQKFKGSYNEGTLTVGLGLDTDDTGQILMKAASLVDIPYSFKITANGGDIYYFQAMVMSWVVGVGSVDAIIGAKATLEITTTAAGVGIVEVLAP